MPSIDRLEVSFQKRNTKGLDAYEHEQASVTAVVALDEGEDPNSALSQTSTAVRGQVHALLGLPGDNVDMPAGARATVNEAPPEKTPTDAAREQPAPPHPAAKSDQKPVDENGNPVASHNTSNVRGHNADNLAAHLKAVHDAGNPVPDSQIQRLPKKQAQEVRKYIDAGVDQEPAGSHDDPPVGDEAADATGGVLNEDVLGDSGSQDGSDGAPAPEPSEAAGDGDDIMAQLESEMEPQEEITDKHLQDRLRDAASRAGSPKVIMPAVQTYTTDGKHLSTIPQDQRQSFLNRVEQLVKQAQEAQ
jgi:hypothetical protein